MAYGFVFYLVDFDGIKRRCYCYVLSLMALNGYCVKFNVL